MNNFIKKLLQFCLGPIFAALISIVMIPLITHFLLPEALGKASMLIIAQMPFAVANLGLDQAYAREYHVEKDKQNLLLTAMTLPISLSIIIFILFIINANSLSMILFEEDHYNLAIYLIGFSAITVCIERFILQKIRMEEKALEYSFFIFASKISLALITTIMIIFFRTDFLAIIYATIISKLIVQFILFYRYRRIFCFSQFKLNKQLNKRLLLFGAPLVLSTLLGAFFKSAANISLRLFSDFEQLGLFSAGNKITNMLMIVQTAFTIFWMPTAYRWHKEGRKMSDYKLVSDAMLVIMSFGFLLLLFLRPLIIILISDQFSEVKTFISFLSFYPIMYTLTFTTRLGVVFSRKTYLNIIVVSTSLTLNILLNFLLTPSLGALGAAMSIGISYIIYFLFYTFLSFRNWSGFSIKKHLLVIFLMFSLAVVDVLLPDYSIYAKISITIIFLIIHGNTIKNVIERGIRFKSREG